MRWLVVALLATGCDSLFDLDHLRGPDTTDDGGPRDGPHDGANADGSSDATIDAIPNPICASSYGANRYQVKSNGLDWTYADSYCRSLQVAGSTKFSHLVVIRDPNEATTVGALISTSETAWIGLTYVSPDWKWSSVETVTAIPWAPAQPDQIGTQNCGRIVPNVGIDNEVCTTMGLKFICECDDYMAAP